VGHHSEAFVGIDTAKLRNAVAIAAAGRRGEVRYLGEVDTSEAAMRRLVAGLAARYRKLTFCYEAGPTGYGLQRLIESLGHTCMVVAPSLIPKKAGDRVKTNRRDAEGLARLLRAGELTGVWVPDARHEAMRELTRARDAARQDLTRKRQQVSSMLLRLGRHYPGIKTWGARHRSWLANLRLEHREQRFALEEMLLAERQASDRIGRLEQAIREALADWSLAPIVPALMAMRGIDLVSAVTILGEIGDLSRFASPRQLMAYLGWCHRSDRRATASGADRSPRPATAGRGACWSRPRGHIAIRRASDTRSRPRLRRRHVLRGRSPGRRRFGSASGSGHCRARARNRRWSQRRLHASWRPSSGPSLARCPTRRRPARPERI
jgi:transposase